MDSDSRSGAASVYSTFFARLKGCESCNQRKVFLTDMLTSHTFWIGIAVGAIGVYAWHKYQS